MALEQRIKRIDERVDTPVSHPAVVMLAAEHITYSIGRSNYERMDLDAVLRAQAGRRRGGAKCPQFRRRQESCEQPAGIDLDIRRLLLRPPFVVPICDIVIPSEKDLMLLFQL